MPSTVLLIPHLKSAYPQFSFQPGPDYLWSPTDHTVYYGPSNAHHFLLHELSHGLLNHIDYGRDVELIAMERAAWDKASEIAALYDVIVDEGTIETTLDSYRDWLHARSSCPACNATGLQIKKQVYSCPACHHTWRVNEARICGLRRQSL